MIYWSVCDLKIPWDKEIPRENQNQCLKWTKNLHGKIKLLRSIPFKGKQIFYIDIHLFSNASLTGVCAVAYAVVNGQIIFSQNLITRKSRLARKNLSIPLLCITVHVSANHAENVCACLNKLVQEKYMRGQIGLQLKIRRNIKHLLVTGCLKSKEKVLSNGNMFLLKKF